MPFNFIKSVLNAALVLIIYKPISTALKKARVADGGADSYRFDKTAVILTVSGVLIAAACVVAFLVFMGGSIKIG